MPRSTTLLVSVLVAAGIEPAGALDERIEQPMPRAAGAPSAWSEERIRRILRAPSDAEIRSTRETIAGRSRELGDVRLVEQGSLSHDSGEFDVRVFGHRVGGQQHFTAVFVPAGAEPGSLPILVETRGVRFDYPQRDISNGPFVMSFLGAAAKEFVIVEPCLRGHRLRAVERFHSAAGDRRDSWDGAAEDAMAAVSLARSAVAEANDDLVVSFGLSRGGGVALLHGARDERVTAVVALSAPTDWFSRMARPREDWATAIAVAARDFEAPTNDRAAQFYDWFLRDREGLSDDEVRFRLIASSPLYFAERLPPTSVHQGTRDTAVPTANAAALSDLFVRLSSDSESRSVTFHEGAGHLLNGTAASELTRAFLEKHVGRR